MRLNHFYKHWAKYGTKYNLKYLGSYFYILTFHNMINYVHYRLALPEYHKKLPVENIHQKKHCLRIKKTVQKIVIVYKNHL